MKRGYYACLVDTAAKIHNCVDSNLKQLLVEEDRNHLDNNFPPWETFIINKILPQKEIYHKQLCQHASNVSQRSSYENMFCNNEVNIVRLLTKFNKIN